MNLEGTFHVLRAFVALLRPEGNARAKVLCFSGGGASKARANFSAYAASKTGVVRLVETLAEEWREMAIDINSVAPGTVPTRMTEEILQQWRRSSRRGGNSSRTRNSRGRTAKALNALGDWSISC